MPGADLSFQCLFISGEPANEQVYQMIKRVNPTLKSPFLHKLLSALKAMRPQSSLWSGLDVTGGKETVVWNSVPPQLSFSSADDERGTKLLKSLGLEKGQYVCYFSRDAAYLNAFESQNFSYHDYRNADINHYIETLKWLNDQGLKTLRMGSVVKDVLNYDNPLNINYANNHRSDFGDAYLIPHAKLFIGDTSGIYYFAEALGKPNLLINIVPMGLPNVLKDDMYVPKMYFSKKFDRLMTFQEIFESGSHLWFQQTQFDQAEIQLLENTPDEILEATKEMFERLEGRFQESAEDQRRQARYLEIFQRYHPSFTHYPKISCYFLKKYEKQLFP